MTAVPQAMEVGLVLQGGGALGAYEYGGIECLLRLIEAAVENGRNIKLKVVTGVSIGAINAACVVGADNLVDARQRLGRLWNELVVNTSPFIPASVSSNLALLGVDHFYKMRSDLLTWPTWTYLYNTRPMLDTLADHVNFDKLNRSETLIVMTAVDVETGELMRFANHDTNGTKRTTITPNHVLASGSLAPQFPWTDIPETNKPHRYWDGGIIDNTPLGDAIAAFDGDPGVIRVLVIMNLFPAAARLPRSLPEVNERIDQLRFGNRLHQDKKTADRINDLVRTIEALRGQIPGPLAPELQAQYDAAMTYKDVQTFEISLASTKSSEGEYGFRDFSREGVAARHKRGYDLTFAKLHNVIQ